MERDLYEIPLICPEIRGPEWDERNDEGWRWANNLVTTEKLRNQNINHVSYLQFLHGKYNVTLGHAWDDMHLKPVEQEGCFGVYIKDVEEKISDFKRKIEEWPEIELPQEKKKKEEKKEEKS